MKNRQIQVDIIQQSLLGASPLLGVVSKVFPGRGERPMQRPAGLQHHPPPNSAAASRDQHMQGDPSSGQLVQPPL